MRFNEPAFPQPSHMQITPGGGVQNMAEYGAPDPGMTLRDWFAGMALSAFLSSNEAQSQLEEAIRENIKTRNLPPASRREVAREIMSHRAYLLADAMLVERAKETA